jgi:hypothetical protein
VKTRGSLSIGTVVLASSLAVVAIATTTSTRASAEETDSTLLSPPLALSVTPGSGGGPWKLRIENTGDVPVRIAADPRLLVLEVTPPAGFAGDDAKRAKGAKLGRPVKPGEDAKPVRCALPDDARPTNDEGRELVVPGKRSWSATFDPLLYCFGARERAMLVSGATVKARFGWPAPPPKASARPTAKPALAVPPFVASPVGAAVGHVAPAKALEAAPFTLAENAMAPPSLPPAPGSAALSVTMPDALDVARGSEISSVVTITNESDRPLTLLFRSDMVRFNVAGPAGSVTCGSQRVVGSPIRELYSTLPVKGRASTSVLLSAVCPADTFDAAGIYRVTAVVDTSGASGRNIGLRTWDGTATASTPMLLRVRSPRRPPTSSSRPALD